MSETPPHVAFDSDADALWTIMDCPQGVVSVWTRSGWIGLTEWTTRSQTIACSQPSDEETPMSAIPITVTGTIATAPAARTLPSGRACSSFRLAVNHWRMDKDTGEFLNDGTSWFGVDCYGDLARNSTMSLGKGTAVIVSGSLRNREWSTEERSGIAPTVVAEHIGPDLRFGTANYQRAKGQERGAVNPTPKSSDITGTSGPAPWGDLADPASAPVGGSGGSAIATAAAEPAVDPGEASSPEHIALDADGNATSPERTALDADGNASSSDDSAIAASTAAAAAPF